MMVLTGNVAAKKRKAHWDSNRVVFCTPQTIENDLKHGICPSDKIVLLVVDEAHKATGNYAYVNVVRKIADVHPFFRVLALSATPGSTVEAVQEVVSNLLISKIEVRTEDSDDVQSHVHDREIEKIEVPLGNSVHGVKEAFAKVLSIPVKFLQDCGALFRKNVSALTKGSIYKAREGWRERQHDSSVRDEGKRIQIEANFGTTASPRRAASDAVPLKSFGVDVVSWKCLATGSRLAEFQEVAEWSSFERRRKVSSAP